MEINPDFVFKPGVKYLIQDGNPTPLIWSKGLVRRKDMRLYDPSFVKESVKNPAIPEIPKIPIVLQGKTFMVELELHEMLTSMLRYIAEKKAGEDCLVEKLKEIEAREERAATDAQDLKESMAKIIDLQKEIGKLKSSQDPQLAGPELVNENSEDEPKPKRRRRSN